MVAVLTAQLLPALLALVFTAWRYCKAFANLESEQAPRHRNLSWRGTILYLPRDSRRLGRLVRRAYVHGLAAISHYLSCTVDPAAEIRHRQWDLGLRD